jgi:hypothetical protein
VNSHPHAGWSFDEFRLRFSRCCESRLSRREDDEKRVTLSIDLHPAMTRKRFPQRAPMRGQGLRVRLAAKLMQQPRRTLDVGEEKSHRAAGEIAQPRQDPAFLASMPSATRAGCARSRTPARAGVPNSRRCGPSDIAAALALGRLPSWPPPTPTLRTRRAAVAPTFH